MRQCCRCSTCSFQCINTRLHLESVVLLVWHAALLTAIWTCACCVTARSPCYSQAHRPVADRPQITCLGSDLKLTVHKYACVRLPLRSRCSRRKYSERGTVLRGMLSSLYICRHRTRTIRSCARCAASMMAMKSQQRVMPSSWRFICPQMRFAGVRLPSRCACLRFASIATVSL